MRARSIIPIAFALTAALPGLAHGQYKLHEACPALPPDALTDSDFVYRPCQVQAPAMWRNPRLLAKYPSLFFNGHVSGSVTLQFALTSAGTVDTSTIQVLKSSHDVFTEASRRAVDRWRATPALRGGHRVREVLTHTILFVADTTSRKCQRRFTPMDDTTVVCRRL
jgi:TonB family protein